ncbi:conserved hypothetical protein [Solidesulfovibrio fructosivorans JJ]]|uniref:Dinitrogenase iron-molybdenum cofactor biosynthesis domain-containing protein n=1 Tax=Solidesulfovibrio fructosivorans JJ] TaxID=596151 RepID=E1K1Y5_SOLFR|nr:hypothetical protein [Solidesulfovibrio fructosivorans]EFL49391.1 conserved hypothetical protein [Solidesulfovibrio fructosivorans JJ]]
MSDVSSTSNTPRRCPRVCLACHGQRLATLLETATTMRLFRFEAKGIVEEAVWAMPDEGLPGLALLLARAGVALLVCGGATCCCLRHFSRRGVAVAPWIAGEVPAVLDALRQNRLETLLAPGARQALEASRRGGTKIQRLESESS